MTDLSLTIAPKSDQLNSDDLIGGPMTIRITKVSACPDSVEQPIAIYFDGDNGKPYKPCKSMRRVMVHVWGKDGLQYPGHSMTLYRDPKVTFGGLAVGGIRISHMSHIEAEVTMALTATRANRKPFTVRPLAASTRPARENGTQRAKPASSAKATPRFSAEDQKWLDDWQGSFDEAHTTAAVKELETSGAMRQSLENEPAPMREQLRSMVAAAYARLAPKPASEIENDPDGEVEIVGAKYAAA
jgi:hypothetical protein